jgi:uncharacterized protein
MLSHDLAVKRDRLLELLGSCGSCLVAFSGGVDSAVVAKAAQLALGESAIAVTGQSESLAQGELQQARALADQIGIRHEIVSTREFENPDYVRNAPDRCYHCKSELYLRMDQLKERFGVRVAVNGANADDLGDYRPGMKAAQEHEVKSPLAECGLTKDEVRRLAKAWDLPVWDKPASPCLSSRVAYGEEVTPERLQMIDQAERWLRRQGLDVVRVRWHKGDLARIEAPISELPQLCEPALRTELVSAFREIGFRFVSLDLEGFRSGSLNTLVPVESLGAAGKGN